MQERPQVFVQRSIAS